MLITSPGWFNARVDLAAWIDPFAPARLGPITLRNRFIKAATFEGRSPKNVVTDRLIDFHREVAAGGVGMTTVAYCAVSRDGRSAPGEIVLTPEAMPGLRRLTDAVHAEGAAACAQIGHAGPVAGAGQAGIAPSRVFSPMAMKLVRAATADDIARVTAEFARAATIAVEAGFDAIELHLGHGYLLSAFMSPKLNRRKDGYGGDVTRRARFPREVARAVRDAVDDKVAVTAKFNMSDGVRGGLDVDESIEIARLLEKDQTLDALELTGGSSFANPMYLFRGDRPLEEMAVVIHARVNLLGADRTPVPLLVKPSPVDLPGDIGRPHHAIRRLLDPVLAAEGGIELARAEGHVPTAPRHPVYIRVVHFEKVAQRSAVPGPRHQVHAAEKKERRVWRRRQVEIELIDQEGRCAL